MDCALDKEDWVPLQNSSYIMKYAFFDTGYCVLLSNLTAVYGEKMTDTDIGTRFNNLNSYVQMKPKVIVEKLKDSMKKCLVDHSLHLSFKLDNQVTITLNFHAANVVCKYEIELNLMPAEKVMQYIIAPTVFGALLSQRKILELQKKVTSVETAGSSGSETLSPEDAIYPDWLKGKNVPDQMICESFLKLQKHFQDLSAENYEAYNYTQKLESGKASKALSASPHKKSKVVENKDESGVNFLDENDGHPVSKELAEINSSMKRPKTARRKKPELKNSFKQKTRISSKKSKRCTDENVSQEIRQNGMFNGTEIPIAAPSLEQQRQNTEDFRAQQRLVMSENDFFSESPRVFVEVL